MQSTDRTQTVPYIRCTMRHPALFFEHRPIFFFLILLIVSITTCRDTSSNSLAKELLAQWTKDMALSASDCSLALSKETVLTGAEQEKPKTTHRSRSGPSCSTGFLGRKTSNVKIRLTVVCVIFLNEMVHSTYSGRFSWTCLQIYFADWSSCFWASLFSLRHTYT